MATARQREGHVASQPILIDDSQIPNVQSATPNLARILLKVRGESSATEPEPEPEKRGRGRPSGVKNGQGNQAKQKKTEPQRRNQKKRGTIQGSARDLFTGASSTRSGTPNLAGPTTSSTTVAPSEHDEPHIRSTSTAVLNLHTTKHAMPAHWNKTTVKMAVPGLHSEAEPEVPGHIGVAGQPSGPAAVHKSSPESHSPRQLYIMEL